MTDIDTGLDNKLIKGTKSEANTANTILDDELIENIKLAANTANTIILCGKRQYDNFMIKEGEILNKKLESICYKALEAGAAWVFDPAKNNVRLEISSKNIKLDSKLPIDIGSEKEMTLDKACQYLSKTKLKEGEEKKPYLLIINAGLLMQDASKPAQTDFLLLQTLEAFSRQSKKLHIIILRVGELTEIPNKMVSSSFVKSIHIPPASRDVRYEYALKYTKQLAAACKIGIEDMADSCSKVTEGWTLAQLNHLFQTAKKQGLKRLDDLEDLSYALKIGTTTSPWVGERIREAVGTAGTDLPKRVSGQKSAVDAVVSSLKKSVIGLSNAHQGRGSEAPRAIFFFSGPTGTGKTELAKAISQTVFGQEQVLRFDCGELRQEQAVARLIGAPPGYVGYDSGGELTKGIQEKPNSVILFDEIEKAHPRLLDTLLSVLDDGRLTSGQGETAFFGQSILIFTSNLGMYKEQRDEDGNIMRKACFNYKTPFKNIQENVREAVRKEFVDNLGRPELLGRFGGAESIIVFDFLRDLKSVCNKFMDNIIAECERLHSIELKVENEVIQYIVDTTKSREDSLFLGARGLKSQLDQIFTNSLVNYLFPDKKNTSITVTLKGNQVDFSE